MNILVTGGAGFIGSHSVDAFIAQGHHVIILDNFVTGRRTNVHKDATLIEGDLRTINIDHIIATHQIERCLHLAAQASVPISVKDPLRDAEHNIVGTLRLLKACTAAHLKKIVFASTGGAIYKQDNTQLPYTEHHTTEPISPYAIAKEAAERYITFYSSAYQLPSIILRYSNVYGPRQNAEGEAGVVAIFASRMLTNKELFINGDGEQTRDYVYVKDVARINALAVLNDEQGVYNVGTGKETTVNELFTAIKLLTQKNAVEQHAPARTGEVRRSALNATKAYDVFGWKPQFTLEQGLEETIHTINNEYAHAL